MDELHLPSAIENSQCLLVAGAGGGFDVIALAGEEGSLANLSFVSLGTTNAQAVTAGTGRPDCRWFHQTGPIDR